MSDTAAHPRSAPSFQWSVGAPWLFYFAGKLYFAWQGLLDPIIWQNAFLLALVALPVPAGWRYRRPLVAGKVAVTVVAAIFSLWADSWLPPLRTAVEFIADPKTRPTFDYILGFLAHFLDFDPVTLAALAGILVAAFAVAAFPPATLTAGVLALVGVQAIQLARASGRPDERLRDFWAAESKRVVSFRAPPAADAPFDIVFIHVCSLSWDDLAYADIREPEFFSRFQYLWTGFNSATGYSEVAAYRLMRSACGQAPHALLTEPARAECYLFDDLRRIGYSTATVFNHTGEYDDMAKLIADLGHADPLSSNEGLPVAIMNFDGTPIFSDYDELERWWRNREASAQARALLYYDTITLHDGNHAATDNTWWLRPRGPKVYREAFDELAGGLGRFFDLVEKSGRNVVVVFLPEHGRALRPTKIQGAQLRDIPLPELTHVPVGIKLIGPGWAAGATERISARVSYQAIAYTLSKFIDSSPFGGGKESVAGVMHSLPTTDFVSENEDEEHLVEENGEYYFYGKRRRWVLMPPLGGGTVGEHFYR